MENDSSVLTSSLTNRTPYFKDTITFAIGATGANLSYQWYHTTELVPGIVTNSLGAAKGAFRVLRGGGWGGDATYCPVAYQNYGDPDYRDYYIGCRVVCP